MKLGLSELSKNRLLHNSLLRPIEVTYTLGTPSLAPLALPVGWWQRDGFYTTWPRNWAGLWLYLTDQCSGDMLVLVYSSFVLLLLLAKLAKLRGNNRPKLRIQKQHLFLEMVLKIRSQRSRRVGLCQSYRRSVQLAESLYSISAFCLHLMLLLLVLLLCKYFWMSVMFSNTNSAIGPG